MLRRPVYIDSPPAEWLEELQAIPVGPLYRLLPKVKSVGREKEHLWPDFWPR
jgi:hypothetical protein